MSDYRRRLAEMIAQPSTVDVRDILHTTPVESGGMVPLTRYADGSTRLDWSAGLPGAIGHAFTLPGRAYRGEVSDSDIIPEALNFAGTFAGAGLAAPKPTNAAGIFGGRLAKTADHSALTRAEQMAANGTPREGIWSETGWFKGADGNWRFEIPDHAASVHSTADWAPASQHFRHPALEAAYPAIKDVDSLLAITPNSQTRASFFPDTPPMMTVQAPTATAAKGAGLHELQHWVSGVEGFAAGTTPEAARALPQFNEAMGAFSTEAARRGVQLDHAQLSTARDRLARELYRRTTGEVEARAVEARMGMTPEQRRQLPPWKSYDVPETEIIPPWAKR